MIAKRRKKKRSDLFFLILMIFSFSLIAGFLVYSNINLANKTKDLVKEREELEMKIKILKEKKANLEEAMSRSKTEDFLEERLREQGYQKPGEKQVIILPPEEKENSFQNFFNWIKSKFGE